MGLFIFGLAVSLAIILISCELFTNGIEWLGKMLKLGDGVVGSILSAVGTCLPETMIPVIAILFSNKNRESMDVGIGAILGAPFMLSTLAFFVTGFSVLVFWKRRRTGLKMIINGNIVKRDIGFFIVVYSLGIAAAFIQNDGIKKMTALCLVLFYIYYILLTIRRDTHTETKVNMLYLTKYANMPLGAVTTFVQIFLALAGIIFGAEIFVKNIEDTSHLFGVSPMILSLIITPIATELPEKFNSIIWVARKKDTLALGNITGAMVFQSCIPVAIGITATSWKLDSIVLLSAFVALMSAFMTFMWIKIEERLTPLPLIAGGAFYLMFLLILLRSI